MAGQVGKHGQAWYVGVEGSPAKTVDSLGREGQFATEAHVLGSDGGDAEPLAGDGGVGVEQYNLAGAVVDARQEEGDVKQGSGGRTHETGRHRSGCGGAQLPVAVSGPVAQLRVEELEQPTADFLVPPVLDLPSPTVVESYDLSSSLLALSTAEKNRAFMAKNMMIATADVTRPVMPAPLPLRTLPALERPMAPKMMPRIASGQTTTLRTGTVNPDAEIDHEGPVTPYRQLAGILKARIKRGDWQDGRPVASETRLVQEYGLARSTRAPDHRRPRGGGRRLDGAGTPHVRGAAAPGGVVADKDRG